MTTSKPTQSIVRHRTLAGVVVSVSGTKSIVAEVNRTKVHPKYGKRFQMTKCYHIHDETNAYKVGEAIRFEECRPLSKTKRWRALPKASAK